MSDITSNTTRVLPDLTKAEAAAPAPKQVGKGTKAPATAKSAPKKADKKAVPAPAGKAPASKPTAPKGKERKYSPDLKITVLKKDVPAKKNGRNPYAIYKTGMTIGEFIKAGGYRADIPWDVKHGVIRIG